MLRCTPCRTAANGSNGVFVYGTTSAFPNSGFQGSNYWVDVVLAVPVSLQSIAVTPASSSLAVGSSQQFTATGTYTDGSIKDISSQATWSSSNTAAATVSSSGLVLAVNSGSASIKATSGSISASTGVTTSIQPLTITTNSLTTSTAGLPYSMTLVSSGGQPAYTWSLVSGSALPAGLSLSSGGLISGTPTLPGTYSFSAQVTDIASRVASKLFNLSVAQTPSSFTIWPSTAVPTVVDAGSDAGVELGVRFKSDITGSIAGVRFYKSAANAGPHVVNLWTNTGTLVATATSSNETASGWQQVNFSSPVPITANTVYVASYHANGGDYSVDQNYFASSGVDNYPLHAIQDGVSGPDGAFGYGTTSVFPSSGYLGSNYWVDVAFQVSAALNAVAITPSNPTLTVGTNQQFTATGTYSDGSTKNITSQVTWTSSNTSVATINAAGVATPLRRAVLLSLQRMGVSLAVPTPLIQVAVIAITTTSLPAALVNQPYSATLAATGGVSPYTWSIASGALPTGLSLASTGQLTGTPTATGAFSFV